MRLHNRTCSQKSLSTEWLNILWSEIRQVQTKATNKKNGTTAVQASSQTRCNCYRRYRFRKFRIEWMTTTTTYYYVYVHTLYYYCASSSIGPPASPFSRSCSCSSFGCMYVAETILSTMDRNGAAAVEPGCVSKNPSPRSHDASMLGSMGSLPRKGTANDAAIASGPE